MKLILPVLYGFLFSRLPINQGAKDNGHPLRGKKLGFNVLDNEAIKLFHWLVNWVRKEIGPIASPDLIQFAPGLPKTRSGKIMRRILRKIAEDEFGSLGDTSTLADPSVVSSLKEQYEDQEG